MHRVVALVVDEIVAFDLAIPAQVFGREPERYAWAVCAPAPGPVPTETGFDVLVPHGLEALERADTVVVPGLGDRAWPLPPEPLEALRAAAAGAAPASRRSAPARSCSPPPACSTAAARRRTGATPSGSRASSRA